MVIQAIKLRILDPTVAPLRVEGAVAPRPDDLSGKSVGLLANGKRNADRFLDILADLLAERYSLKEVVVRNKGDASSPAPDAMLDELAQLCDAVIVGVGD